MNSFHLHYIELVNITVNEDKTGWDVQLLHVSSDTCDHTQLWLECWGDCMENWDHEVDSRFIHYSSNTCHRKVIIHNSSFTDCDFGLIITDKSVIPCGDWSDNPNVTFCSISGGKYNSNTQ